MADGADATAKKGLERLESEAGTQEYHAKLAYNPEVCFTCCRSTVLAPNGLDLSFRSL